MMLFFSRGYEGDVRVVEAIGRGQRGLEGCQIDDERVSVGGELQNRRRGASTVLCVELQTGI